MKKINIDLFFIHINSNWSWLIDQNVKFKFIHLQENIRQYFYKCRIGQRFLRLKKH